MSVYQVEDYYIYINTESYDKEAIKNLEDHLKNLGHDFEIQDGSITIDGFQCEYEAETIEREIMTQLSGQ
jgi:hypothetical protein